MIRKAMKQRFDTVQSMINSAAEAIEKYSPTQARAPAGTDRGGQWTSGGGGGASEDKLKEQLAAEYAALDANDQEEFKRLNQLRVNELEVGQFVSFKSDIEQSAEIVEIKQETLFDRRRTKVFVVKAPPDGFSGSYIGRSDFYNIYASDAWVE